MAAHLVRDEGVAGSNPATPTSFLTSSTHSGPVMGNETDYYVEQYEPNGVKAKEHWRFGDGAAALDRVRSIIAVGDIARIRCPVGTPREHLAELERLGAQVL